MMSEPWTVTFYNWQPLTYQVAIQIDDLKCWVAAGGIGKQPDRLLVLFCNAHSHEADLS